jgi:hypothetical protein
MKAKHGALIESLTECQHRLNYYASQDKGFEEIKDLLRLAAENIGAAIERLKHSTRASAKSAGD